MPAYEYLRGALPLNFGSAACIQLALGALAFKIPSINLIALVAMVNNNIYINLPIIIVKIIYCNVTITLHAIKSYSADTEHMLALLHSTCTCTTYQYSLTVEIHINMLQCRH